MPSSGIPLQQVTEIMQSTSYQTFPVVRSDTDRTIIGSISRNELRYALDRARRAKQLAPDATCTFQEVMDATAPGGVLSEPDIVLSAGDGRAHESTRVDFGQYVDETPITVSPKMPLEIVLQLFRRMGPRVILVSHEGQLAGLVTIKDVLRHEATEKHREEVASVSHSRLGSWDQEWTPMPGDPTPPANQAALEHLLEDGFQWAQTHGVTVVNDVIARVRNVRGGSAGPRNDEAYRFEADPERQD